MMMMIPKVRPMLRKFMKMKDTGSYKLHFNHSTTRRDIHNINNGNPQLLENSHSQEVASLQNHIDSFKDAMHKKDNEILTLKQELRHLRQQKDSGPLTKDEPSSRPNRESQSHAVAKDLKDKVENQRLETNKLLDDKKVSV